MGYEYLSEIIEQLEKCNFKDEKGHLLINNVAFIELKKHQICDGMSSKSKCDHHASNFLCSDCLDRVYQTPQG
jgi:adenylosuccinate synthase